MKCVPIKGIITPILTPMNADESVNLDELRRQIERLIAGGVHGIFPFGTNGEGYILSMEEKISVLEATIDQVKGRVPVYAGTGCVTPSPSAVRRSAWARTSCPSLPPALPWPPSRSCMTTTARSPLMWTPPSCCTTSRRVPATSCCRRPCAGWPRMWTSPCCPATTR